jgi:LytS/YehU family sensor histidine kinase
VVIISAVQTRFHLHIEIINTGQFHPPIGEQGLGIDNTRERLAILYDSQASFSIENFNEKEVITKIDIPV